MGFWTELVIVIISAVLILGVIAYAFTADITKVYIWVVYHNRGSYKIHYLDSMHEVIYISKSYEVNGVEFVTSSKKEACGIANSLNISQQNWIAAAKAKEWHRISC